MGSTTGTTRTATATLRYKDAAGRVRAVTVAAETKRAIETFDRAIRRANALHRAKVTTNTKGLARESRSRRAEQIVGYLAVAHEPAARRLGAAPAGKGGRWEGPSFRFDRLLGEGLTWSGEVFRWLSDRGVCPVCRGGDLGGVVEGEVVVTTVCLWCGRSNVEHLIR